MDSLVSDAFLFTTLAFFCIHVVLVAVLKPRVSAASRQILFAWASVSGGHIESLKFKYLLPWVPLPPLPTRPLYLLRAAQASASIAVASLLIMVLVGFVVA
jgi:hypothetical protein